MSLCALSCAFANLRAARDRCPYLPKWFIHFSGDPFSEIREILVWARDYLDGDDFADALGGFSAGFDGSFERRDIAAEKSGDMAGADGFVASHRDVGRFESGV